ncbi:cyclin-dependent kinase inhibitor 3 [Aplysia californica]|uniref:protein-tyrosine-phosphatase n=1 Tax=Aplysia californica TaxID=6500 RepID=A0ABM0JJ45_APLCA|nr:cyclin-dependent kinase inhibitor 3 [Aplysia californica]XP_035824726.1 cyclin-dependent kinase inhibitor 3 [Aplysia californica]
MSEVESCTMKPNKLEDTEDMMDANQSLPDGVSADILDQSDLSDKEDAEQLDLTPFQVDWLDLQVVGCDQKLGISPLPGCRYQDTWRSLVFDVECLKKEGIEDVFCLCTKRELYMCRATKLLDKYGEAGFTVHHFPIEDGGVPEVASMLDITEKLRLCLLGGKKTLLHCFGGLGRSCSVAACLIMVMDDSVGHEEAIKRVKDLRGKTAIQSVKQFNFVNEFEEKLKLHKQNQKGVDDRSVSR